MNVYHYFFFIGSGFSDHMIQDIISTYMVLPNRITVPLIGEVELARLRFPMPKVNTHTNMTVSVLIVWQTLHVCINIQ